MIYRHPDVSQGRFLMHDGDRFTSNRNGRKENVEVPPALLSEVISNCVTSALPEKGNFYRISGRSQKYYFISDYCLSLSARSVKAKGVRYHHSRALGWVKQRFLIEMVLVGSSRNIEFTDECLFSVKVPLAEIAELELPDVNFSRQIEDHIEAAESYLNMQTETNRLLQLVRNWTAPE